MQQETVDRIQQETAEDGGSGVESPRGDIENAGEMRPELRGGGSV